ncbi:MAG: UTP--glucose-1-phosphate uridylyltransferase GalU [Victivallaceae bacterium]|nr:UTP--glucose-1-phosphate uridylyltransferase GalU [Victivallaceae bacterium]
MMIRKAVIPAAGFGTRFLPFTKSVPKEMIPLVDKPVIQYVVEEAVAAGITDILIVVSSGKMAIQEHFNPDPGLLARLEDNGRPALADELRAIDRMARLHFVYQQELKGLGDAVLQARGFVGDEPFAVLLGDTVTTSEVFPVIGQLCAVSRQKGASVVALEEVPWEKTSRYGVIDGTAVAESVYKVKTFIEKPSPDEAPSNLAIAARYVFTPEIFGFLENTIPGKGGEIQLTDAMREMVRTIPMYGCRFDGRRHDIGDKLEFIKATVEFSLKRPEFRDNVGVWLKDLSTRLKD